MARIRSIKPEYWTDRKIVSLSFPARLLFIGSWNFTRCDQGHLDDDALALRLKVLPADPVDAEDLLDELIDAGLIERIENEGRTYLHIRRFTDHQKIETRWNARCPYCSLQTTPNHAETPPTSAEEGKGKEGIGKEEDVARAFEKFWNIYPARKGRKLEKGKAAEAWKRLKNSERDCALEAVANYAKACNNGETIAKDAFRWLRDRAFNDWREAAASTVVPFSQSNAAKVALPPLETCDHGMSIKAFCEECDAEASHG